METYYWKSKWNSYLFYSSQYQQRVEQVNEQVIIRKVEIEKEGKIENWNIPCKEFHASQPLDEFLTT